MNFSSFYKPIKILVKYSKKKNTFFFTNIPKFIKSLGVRKKKKKRELLVRMANFSRRLDGSGRYGPKYGPQCLEDGVVMPSKEQKEELWSPVMKNLEALSGDSGRTVASIKLHSQTQGNMSRVAGKETKLLLRNKTSNPHQT